MEASRQALRASLLARMRRWRPGNTRPSVPAPVQQRSREVMGDTDLERDHELPTGQRGEHVCHVGVARGRDVTFTKVVAFCRVESCRDCEGR